MIVGGSLFDKDRVHSSPTSTNSCVDEATRIEFVAGLSAVGRRLFLGLISRTHGNVARPSSKTSLLGKGEIEEVILEFWSLLMHQGGRFLVPGVHTSNMESRSITC